MFLENDIINENENGKIISVGSSMGSFSSSGNHKTDFKNASSVISNFKIKKIIIFYIYTLKIGNLMI